MPAMKIQTHDVAKRIGAHVRVKARLDTSSGTRAIAVAAVKDLAVV
jgi:hypothetical protein